MPGAAHTTTTTSISLPYLLRYFDGMVEYTTSDSPHAATYTKCARTPSPRDKPHANSRPYLHSSTFDGTMSPKISQFDSHLNKFEA